MKRNLGQEQFITPKKILEVLGGATGEIAATFINTKEVDGKRVVTKIQYFDRQTLRDFLYINDPERNGLLQKFLSIRQQKYASASVTNQTLQTLHVTWQKGALRTTKVVQSSHFLRLVEPHNGIDNNSSEERRSYQYATADALPYGQVTIPLQSHLSRKIREACERIAEHVETVTDGAVRITRMVGSFKVGHKGQLWFNFPASVDVEDSGIDHTFELPGVMPSQPLITLPREEAFSKLAVWDGTASSVKIDTLQITEKSDRAFALKNKDFMMPCAFCADTVESMRSCSMTLHETIMFLQESCPEITRQHEVVEEGSAVRASQMWSDMRFDENDEITLPEIRWRMKQMQVPQDIVDTIETGIALADSEIRGVIDLNLFSRGVAYSTEQAPPRARSSNKKLVSRGGRVGSDTVTPRGTGSPSSPSYLSGIAQANSPDTTHELLHVIMTGSRDLDSVLRAAAAGGTHTRKAKEPHIVMHLRSTLAPRVFARMTAPDVLERESIEFLSTNVEVCTDCHRSIKMFLAKRGDDYWDGQLTRLLQRVPGSRQMTSHGIQSSPSSRRPTTVVDRMWSR